MNYAEISPAAGDSIHSNSLFLRLNHSKKVNEEYTAHGSNASDNYLSFFLVRSESIA